MILFGSLIFSISFRTSTNRPARSERTTDFGDLRFLISVALFVCRFVAGLFKKLCHWYPQRLGNLCKNFDRWIARSPF
jgi:hypothetical protein